MDKLLQLKQAREAVLAEAIAKAEALTDASTDEDRKAIEALEAQVDKYDKDIEAEQARLDHIDALRAKQAQPMPTVTGGTCSTHVDASIPSVWSVPAQAKDPNEGKFKNLGEQLVAVVEAARGGGRIDPRLRAATGMSESVGSDGGFLVQQDFAGTLLQTLFQTGILLSRARRVTVGPNANGLRWTAVNETSRVDGSRWGGIKAYWAAEAGSKTKSAPALRQIQLNLKKLIGLCYATDELLQDATALESLIRTWFPEEIGFRLDDAMINGTGAGMPLGVLVSPALISVAKETGQTAATIVAENVEKMYARMPASSIPSAVWHINQNCWPQIFQLHHAIGTGGVPMFMLPGSIPDAPFGALLGRPILPIEQCQACGTLGDILFVDWSQYQVIDKGGIQSDFSIHVKFTYDESCFRWVYRVDGQPIWASALTPFKGGATNTISPYIALAART